jgi:hypothetical protein
MFDNYNSRLGIYSACTGFVQFCIGGHCHRDYTGQSDTGIPIILCDTDGFNTRSGNTATYGTITESCISGVVADFNTHTVHVIRCGRGVDSNVPILNFPINYTNIIPLSTELDGTTIYNASGTPGYKANVRWSGSSKAEQTLNGSYLTGWWEFGNDNTPIYYVKNLNITSSAQIAVIGYNTTTQETASATGDTFDSKCSPVWDTTTGQLKSFKTNFANVDLWRLQVLSGAIVTDESIITKNEVID